MPRLVTPYAGVGIEIFENRKGFSCFFVTPYAGVGIEIDELLPDAGARSVTPYAGVGIEIGKSGQTLCRNACHTLCGCGD